MATSMLFSQALRAIGQSLESRKIQDFQLLINDEFILVRKMTTNKMRKGSWLSRLLLGSRGDTNDPILQYSGDDVRSLQAQGESQRAQPDLTPEFIRLSQTLRTVGAYIDNSAGRFLSLTRSGPMLTVEFEGALGRKRVEEHVVESFHNYFMQMYLHRKTRQAGPK